jgi:hypothetical protein
VILDDEHRARWQVVQPHLDAVGSGVAAHVGQRLLSGPVQRQTRLRRELARLAVHLDRDRQTALFAERVREQADPLGPGELVAALGGDRATGLVESGRGEMVSVVERARHLAVHTALACEQARSLELQRERGQ